jgi:DNA-binding MarR family transcriptional regulator
MEMSSSEHFDVAADLGEAVSRLQAHVRRELAGGGASLAQGRTLITLSREGAQRLTTLAAMEQVTQPTMSVLVNRMEVAGLVTRASSPEDGRTVLVSITDLGRAQVEELQRRRAQILAAPLARLDPDELAALHAALPALARLVDLVTKGEPIVAKR